MIAGKPRDENEEIIAAIRTICPNVGYRIKKGKLILTGNDINHLSDTISALSKIKEIAMRNAYCTEAEVVANGKPEVGVEVEERGVLRDHSNISPLAGIDFSKDFCGTCQQKENNTWNCTGCPIA